ncbi:metallopeptidase family protein [Oceanicaulis sp. LC35]|uniref:metallopeptidase family protein n=1 Tax=Oceanicaulis sp. LC35 TaxID=3349635 RepID=UPI003F8623E0
MFILCSRGKPCLALVAAPVRPYLCIMFRTRDLSSLTAPDEAQFLEIAQHAWEGLPEQFRALCGNVVIQTPDFADEATLNHFNMDSPYQLTGLYHGVDLPHKSVLDPAPGPDYVFLYRLPILLEWCERGNVTLAEIITHVLVHEIGHHFGLSDDDMHVIEDQAD